MNWLAFLGLLIVASIVAAADLGWARPVLNAVNNVPMGDKLCHFLFVGGLCYLIAMARAKRRPRRAAAIVRGTMLVVAAVATVEELSQLLFVERTFSLTDLACNYAGIGVFGGLALWSCPKASEADSSSVR